jgi:hypothetical protein
MCEDNYNSMLNISVWWRKPYLLLLLLVFIVISVDGMLCLTAGEVYAGSVQADKPSQGQTDLQRLEGRWVRPDGGYVLELTEIKKDGGLKASYFNPRPINVSKATWSRKEGRLNLFVELRDVNYPGSTYTLQYDPKSDRLRGTYFQAVEKQTFSIEFVRAK